MNASPPASQPTWLARAVATITEVVFPPVCAVCGRLGTILCEQCHTILIPVEGTLCMHCGRVLGSRSAASSSLCSKCSTEPPLLRQSRAPLLYTEPTSELIHRLKYDGYFALAKPLGTLMAERWPAWDQAPDLILPVPLHTRRQRQRGFNQSALLGRQVAQQAGVAFEEKSLRRHRHTQPQVNLGPDERRVNVAGAFVADVDRVAGRHILLVDDVYTTGATMAAAAEALVGAGALTVSGYCLARVS